MLFGMALHGKEGLCFQLAHSVAEHAQAAPDNVKHAKYLVHDLAVILDGPQKGHVIA